MKTKRVFLIVLDSFGVGELPDAAKYGDCGSDTFGAVSRSEYLDVQNMRSLGLFNIDGVSPEGAVESPRGAFGRAAERSAGKDTTTGHWEIAGVVSEKPMPTFPDGFPQYAIDEFSRLTGRGVLCNKPYSGTQVILDYGRQHMETGNLIVYTSADSVFQIAAHEDIVPLEELYGICRTARSMLKGELAVGRVIARPFKGEYPNFYRTSGRHDFSLEPTGETMLDRLKASGFDVISVGKINDIFASRGVTDHRGINKNNADGMEKTLELQKEDFNGLCFVNLVDFDMLFGHRNDVDGYAKALTEFDGYLGRFLENMRIDDVLIITADHGCDPSTPSTDHSREYIPIIVCGDKIKAGVNIGYLDICARLLRLACAPKRRELSAGGIGYMTGNERSELFKKAAKARLKSYSPYSGYSVGAALLCSDGSVYTGCNIENAAYTPTVCAERTAFFKAVSDGRRDFRAIAVAGGKDGVDACTPCGVCRQVMAEFCDCENFEIICNTEHGLHSFRLKELLPGSFGPANLKQEKQP